MAFRFESLEIWHLARAYATTIYEVTGRFPRKEDYGLTLQLNRAANCISFNIAYQLLAIGHQPKERGDAYWKKQKESFANHEIHKSLNKEEAK